MRLRHQRAFQDNVLPQVQPKAKSRQKGKGKKITPVVSKAEPQPKLVIKLRIRPRKAEAASLPRSQSVSGKSSAQEARGRAYSSSLTPMSQLSCASSPAPMEEKDDQYAEFDMLQPIVVAIIAPAPAQRGRNLMRRVFGRLHAGASGSEEGRESTNAIEDAFMADSESSSQSDGERAVASAPPRNGWMATVMNDSPPQPTASSSAGHSQPPPDVAEAWLNQHIKAAAEAFEEKISPMMLSPSPEEAANLPGPIRPPQTYVYPYRGAETFTRYQDRDEQMDTDSD